MELLPGQSLVLGARTNATQYKTMAQISRRFQSSGEQTKINKKMSGGDNVLGKNFKQVNVIKNARSQRFHQWSRRLLGNNQLKYLQIGA